MAKTVAKNSGKGGKVATKGGVPVKKAAPKPEPKEKTPGLDVGMRSGMPVVAFINKTLQDQRKAMYDDPRKMMDDEELQAAIGREFPKKESFQELSAYRNYFNGGLAGMGDPPGEKISETKRLYNKTRAMRMWAQGKYRPKCGACPEATAEKILAKKAKEE